MILVKKKKGESFQIETLLTVSETAHAKQNLIRRLRPLIILPSFLDFLQNYSFLIPPRVIPLADIWVPLYRRPITLSLIPVFLISCYILLLPFISEIRVSHLLHLSYVGTIGSSSRILSKLHFKYFLLEKNCTPITYIYDLSCDVTC